MAKLWSIVNIDTNVENHLHQMSTLGSLEHELDRDIDILGNLRIMNWKFVDEGIGLPPSQFNRVFPFHLAIDENLTIVQFGSSLLRICADVCLGNNIRDNFRLLTPEVEANYLALTEAQLSITVWQHKYSGMRLRGQLLPLKELKAIVFLWSPWLQDIDDLNRYSLRVDDFAIHDPIVDMLQAFQNQEIALQDERALVNNLIQQRFGLSRVNDELSRNFSLLWEKLEELQKEDVETSKIAQIANNTCRAMVMTDATGKVEWVNAGFTNITGYTLEEMLGKTPGSVLQGENSDPRVIEYMQRQMKKGESFGAEIVNYTKSGRELWIQLEVQPIKDVDDQITNWMAIEQDITEQKVSGLALLVAKSEAEAASQAKSTFVATMSHEIRTPLNALLGILELLMDSQLDEEQELWANYALTAGRSLLSTIDDILDFSKIEVGKMSLQSDDFELKALLEEVFQLFRIRTEAKGLDLLCSFDPNADQTFRGDSFRLRQILVNLIENAIKFTDKGSIFVSVSCEEVTTDETLLQVHVKDTGIGISSDAQASLFRQFEQVDTGPSRRFGGSGLGLAICKRLVTMMGGKIGVNSQPGNGSDFWFTAKLEKISDPGTHLDEPSSGKLPATVSSFKIRSSAGKNGKPSDIGQHNRRSKAANILVAEDGEINRIVLRTILVKAGFHVELAEDGKRAFEATREGDYDLILMDVYMPEMDGYQATAAIRRLPDHRAQIPILALSANAFLENRDACLAAGMNDFIAKPVEKYRLLATVSKWLRKGINTPSPAPFGRERQSDDLFDESAMNTLLSSTNDQTVKDVMSIFITETTKQMERFTQALVEKDYKTLKFGAHSLKSTAITIGALRLATVCESLENACFQGDLETALNLTKTLLKIFDETRNALAERGFSAQISISLKPERE